MRVREAATRGNQAPPQTLVVGVQVTINPVAFTDGEVRATLVQMSQAIIAHKLSQPRPLERVLPGRTHMLAPLLAD